MPIINKHLPLFICLNVAECSCKSQLYISNGNTSIVPNNVSLVRVVAVGGGGGGMSGHMHDGGGGFVQRGRFNVTAGAQIPVIVGKGGSGGKQIENQNDCVGNTNGTASSLNASTCNSCAPIIHSASTSTSSATAAPRPELAPTLSSDRRHDWQLICTKLPSPDSSSAQLQETESA